MLRDMNILEAITYCILECVKLTWNAFNEKKIFKSLPISMKSEQARLRSANMLRRVKDKLFLKTNKPRYRCF